MKNTKQNIIDLLGVMMDQYESLYYFYLDKDDEKSANEFMIKKTMVNRIKKMIESKEYFNTECGCFNFKN